VTVEHFAREIEAYFFYHSLRKTKIIQSLNDQLMAEKGK